MLVYVQVQFWGKILWWMMTDTIMPRIIIFLKSFQIIVSFFQIGFGSAFGLSIMAFCVRVVNTFYANYSKGTLWSDESWKPRPELVINLNPGYPSLRSHEPGTRVEHGVSRFDGGSAGRGNAVTSKRCGLVTEAARLYIGGRWKVKHLQIAITCVARAMCGVTETDCSYTASISGSNSEHRELEFNQVMNASRMTHPVVTPDNCSTPFDWTVKHRL